MAQSNDDPRKIDLCREERFLQLFLQHEQRLRSFIFALVHNWTDVDDILQETCTVIWQKLDEFQPGSDFAAWALSIARYQVLNFRKKQQRLPALFSNETVEALVDGMLHLRENQGDARTEALRHCLAKLKDRDRELIHLRYQPGATTAQVAEHVERSLVAVYKALNRIHEQLLLCIRRTLTTEGTT